MRTVGIDDHVHHHAAEVWLAELDDTFATCPITQGTLLRMLLRQGRAAGADAWRAGTCQLTVALYATMVGAT